MKCKLRSFIMEHLLFAFYSCLYVFSFCPFSNISKTVFFGYSHVCFCREFQALSFVKKKGFNHMDNIEEIFKILRGPLFLGHPLFPIFINVSCLDYKPPHRDTIIKQLKRLHTKHFSQWLVLYQNYLLYQ